MYCICIVSKCVNLLQHSEYFSVKLENQTIHMKKWKKYRWLLFSAAFTFKVKPSSKILLFLSREKKETHWVFSPETLQREEIIRLLLSDKICNLIMSNYLTPRYKQLQSRFLSKPEPWRGHGSLLSIGFGTKSGWDCNELWEHQNSN